MAKEVLIKCTCGHEAAYAIDATGVRCKYCKKPIVPSDYVEAESLSPIERTQQIALLNIASQTNPDQVELVMALGLFYLANKAYAFATQKFQAAIDLNPFYADAYYYKAISLLGGKKAFSVLRPVINEIEELLQSALGFNPKGLYYYFWAYIRYDHHARKLYRVSPDYRELIGMAKQFGVSAGEVAGLYRALGVPRPDCI